MSNSLTAEKTALSLAEQVKQAWAAHTKHLDDQALSLFEAVVKQEPTHIDAQYGLGLTLIALKQKDRALTVFGKALELANDRARQQAADDEDPRYTMLSRMISQQIAALQTAK